MLKWSSIFLRFNLNGADHTFHLFGWENFLDSTGLPSTSEKSAATIQCASFPRLKWVHIMPASAMENVRDAVDDRKKKRQASIEKIDCVTKLQIICQSNLIHSWKIVCRRDGGITFLGNVLSRATTISVWRFSG